MHHLGVPLHPSSTNIRETKVLTIYLITRLIAARQAALVMPFASSSTSKVCTTLTYPLLGLQYIRLLL